MKRIIITNFTDPVCSWCWGSEPVFRALETHYPDEIEFRYIMGGLVEDIDDFVDASSGIDGGSDGANAQIISHWLESEDFHGMPIKPDGFHLFSKKFPSSYSQNIAYKAAQMVDKNKADAFLRRLREATLTEAKVTSDPDVQIELASEVGINISEFIKAIDSGEAFKKFRGDKAITYATEVRGFPSFLVKSSSGRQVLVRGYKTFDDFKEVISHLTDASLEPIEVKPTKEGLLELLDKHPKLAREEVRQAFSFKERGDADKWLEELINDGTLIKEEVGKSYFIKRKNRGFCDTNKGIC